MNELNLKPNVCAICDIKQESKLNVMRIVKHKENLHMDIPLCEKHWNEGKDIHGNEISRLFIRGVGNE